MRTVRREGYTAQAAGNAGTPVAGLTYQIDYQNNRTTPNVPSRMDRSNHELLGNSEGWLLMTPSHQEGMSLIEDDQYGHPCHSRVLIW